MGIAVRHDGTLFLHCECIKVSGEKVCIFHTNYFLKLLSLSLKSIVESKEPDNNNGGKQKKGGQ